ncbi:SDR family oxidoreductase [Streptomyces sp. NPDC046716]|uniref:SDR family oxidoreductase n=1 Tax=Streptomyces sp. NPDC046716 TaxID=3157093 RepID=UPI00340CBF7C
MPISRPAARPTGRHAALEGRVAVITGAARGVGAALARQLADAGMRVALIGREGETLREVASRLPQPGLCLETDVTDREALARAAHHVEQELGPASVVVANAGIAVGGPFDRTPAELWDRVIHVNLVGSANTARAFLPQLVQRRGYFLQIASTAAFGSAPMMSAYCASKAGAESFAQALRGETRPDGVAVGIAYLHWTGTGMVTDIDEHPVLQALRNNQPRFARKVHTTDQVATWLARGIASRTAHIYAPPWLRWCQPLRPLFPALVACVTRRELAAHDRNEYGDVVDVLGPGGHADWDVYRGVTQQPR